MAYHVIIVFFYSYIPLPSGVVGVVGDGDTVVLPTVVVGATVVGAAVVGAAVDGATVVGASVVGAVVVGDAVEGATVVGAAVVGAAVVGAAVVGAAVVVAVTEDNRYIFIVVLLSIHLILYYHFNFLRNKPNIVTYME